MGVILREESLEQRVRREAADATRLPRWFWLAAVAVVAAVPLLSGCGGGTHGAEPLPAWQACSDTGWVPLQPTASVSIGSRVQLPPGADGSTAAQAAGQLMLRLPPGATASGTASAALYLPGATTPAAQGQPVAAAATAGADGVAVLPLAAGLPAGTAARTPAELQVQLQATATGGAVTGWRLQWCAQGVQP